MTDTRTLEQRLRDTGEHVEGELRRLVTFLNEEVVPDVRRSSSTALRSAAAELERLARRVDEANNQRTPPAQRTPPKP